MQSRSQGKKEKASKNISGWDEAIADAKQRLREIQFSLMVFRKRKAAGEPWIGTQEKAGTAKEAVPA
jgi:hypothetical protein